MEPLDEEAMRSRHRKELKQWEGEKRAAMKKFKTSAKGKKLKDAMATYVKNNEYICFFYAFCFSNFVVSLSP
jgi:hypothetical protein